MNDQPDSRRIVSRFWSALGSEHVIIGFFFVLVGSAAFLLALDYPAGSATRMRAGYFPRIVSSLLILLGVVIALFGIGGQPKAEEYASGDDWRPTLFVPLAMMTFGGTIESLGLVPAVFATMVVLSYAEKKRRWGEMLALGTILSAFAYFIFVWALGRPIPVLVGF